MELLKNPSKCEVECQGHRTGFLGSPQRKLVVAEGFFLVHAGAKVRCQMLKKVSK